MFARRAMKSREIARFVPMPLETQECLPLLREFAQAFSDGPGTRLRVTVPIYLHMSLGQASSVYRDWPQTTSLRFFGGLAHEVESADRRHPCTSAQSCRPNFRFRNNSSRT